MSFELRVASDRHSSIEGDPVTDFKQLKVWRKALEMTLETYRVTAAFPREEMYGLTSQLRRAAASIGANIAEGCGRRSDGEMCRFLQIARGSASETEYHVLLARDLHLLAEKDFQMLTQKADELQRMLTGLMESIRSPKSA
jgi:four helix bundle protein